MGSKRTKIGIVYRPTEKWIAGAYYVQNILKALSSCKDELQPTINVCCNNHSEFEELKASTKYKYLAYSPLYPERDKYTILINRILKKFTKYRIYTDGAWGSLFDKTVFYYPITDFTEIYNIQKAVAWIPDFQEKYYPEFFSQEDLLAREKGHKELIQKKVPIVFSSHNAEKDFIKFYPEGKDSRTFVLQFSVNHPDFSHELIDELKVKYNITSNYLFCANQFWIHKNHLTLFKAIKILKDSGKKYQLVCSGALSEYRNNSYHQTLFNYIKNNHLENEIRILGFIPRTEQLCLMNNSYAIIHPSLFEGWSTVVEDAKKLNKFIFLSDLAVHREQAPINSCFFSPLDENEIAQKILSVEPSNKAFDYTLCTQRSCDQFLDIINKIAKK